MPENFFRPGPGRYGTHILVATAHAGGGHTIGNAATTILPFQGQPNKQFRVESLSIQAIIAGVDTGTLTAQVFRRNSAGTEVALTATFSLETDFVTGTLPRRIVIPFGATATDSSRVLDPEAGDHLLVRVVSQTSVSTQPNIAVHAELALMK